jgi:NAD(P)-dependent dehydrogenase (short-subunit alcohol dehydrogenase family)
MPSSPASQPSAERPLAGSHALVTGAGRGIGRACALALARSGAGVTLLARSAAELERVVADVAALGVPAYAVAADVTDQAQVARAVAAATGHGDLHVCVNAAGINRPAPTVELAVEDFDAVLATNVRGTFLVCRAVGAALLTRGRGGRIVNLSSQMGSVGYPGRAAYCASKAAVDGLTRALAVEWAREGITVNAVAPTFVETPLTRPMLEDPAFRDEVLRRIPMGRLGELDEVTAAVTFLASPAASLITGAVLPVDGGWTAW